MTLLRPHDPAAGRSGFRMAAGALLLLLAATSVVVAPSSTLGAAAAAAITDWGKLTPGAGDTRIGPAPADMAMQVTLGLTRDAAGLAAFADDVADPASPDYRRFSDVATLAARFGVSDAAW